MLKWVRLCDFTLRHFSNPYAWLDKSVFSQNLSTNLQFWFLQMLRLHSCNSVYSNFLIQWFANLINLFFIHDKQETYQMFKMGKCNNCRKILARFPSVHFKLALAQTEKTAVFLGHVHLWLNLCIVYL